jgi:exopolysaccharide biosynthesis WecB/TagA/CpsF family protein
MNTVFSDPYKMKVIEKVSLLDSFNEALQLIKDKLERKKAPVVVSYINAHGYNLCYTNEDFYQAMVSSDFVFRDGKGIEILYKSLGKAPGINFCGTDSIPFFMEQWPSKKVALIGTTEPYLDNAAALLRSRGFEIVFTRNGFLPLEDYIPLIKEKRPDIIVLGMGMPRQEQLSLLISSSVDFPSLVINGGAVIDYMGKKVKRAPKWIRDLGLEWVFRLALEPKRMFKRYIVGNFVFLSAVWKLKKHLRQIPQEA